MPSGRDPRTGPGTRPPGPRASFRAIRHGTISLRPVAAIQPLAKKRAPAPSNSNFPAGMRTLPRSCLLMLVLRIALHTGEAQNTTGFTLSANGTLCYAGHLVPSRFLLGVQKCGTTSLFGDLARMPGMRIAKHLGSEPGFYAKEQHFFDKAARFQLGMEFYASHYPPCPRRGHVQAVDSTPDYSRHPGVAARLYSAYGERYANNLRFVLIVRDPATRLRSFYDHFHPSPTLREFIIHTLSRAAACASYVNTSLDDGNKLWEVLELGFRECRSLMPLGGSLYAPQLRSWLSVFKPRQFAITCLYGYYTQTAQVRGELQQFLVGRTIAPVRMHTKRARRPRRANRAHARSSLDRQTGQEINDFFTPHRRDFVGLLRKHSTAEGKERLLVTPFRGEALSVANVFHL